MATLLRPGTIVLYMNTYFLYLGNNNSGFARLLLPHSLSIFPGTPNPDKLTVIQRLSVVKHNTGNLYCKTSRGYISLTTGKLVTDKFSEQLKDLWPVQYQDEKTLVKTDSGQSYYVVSLKSKTLIHYIAIGQIEESTAVKLQSNMGYHPQGYNFMAFESNNNISIWSSFSNCD